jgi:nucleotide-binding universal stress UspA family protein
MPRIVVGVDGSEHAARAVRWAVEEARLRGAELELVHAVPDRDMPPYGIAPPPAEEELRAAGIELIDNTLTEVETGKLEVERTAESGTPARRLCKAAEGADLLVVGARGYGGFRGLLLGSVTQQVVAHAPCPVVVVVPEDR